MEGLKPENEKTKLTDDQKARIREEMAKCIDPQAAKERRKQLADEYGASIKQISAVSAYKVGPDGLDLRPQFPKSPTLSLEINRSEKVRTKVDSSVAAAEVPRGIEEMYDNPTKRAWRETIRKVIDDDFTKEQLRDARVVCLPGRALQEVTEVYAALGINPQNITCIERNKSVVSVMRENAKTLNAPVNIFEGSVDDFLYSKHEAVTIASFDFLGPLHDSFLHNLSHLQTEDRFMLITNFLGRRERKTPQAGLSFSTSAERTFRDRFYMRPQKATKEERMKELKAFDVNAAALKSGETVIDLADARDEGMIGMLRTWLAPDLYTHPLDDIYSEIGLRTPSFGDNDHHDFMYKASTEATDIVKRTFEGYPVLFKKVAALNRHSFQGSLGHSFGVSAQGFFEKFWPAMNMALLRRWTCDERRYKYTSESSGSPYQTDILVMHDIDRALKQDHRAAYNFIRMFVALLGLEGEDGISIRLKRFEKTLPADYSGGTTAITLELIVDNRAYARVSLNNLAQFIDYTTEKVSELSTKPFDLTRKEIKAPQ